MDAIPIARKHPVDDSAPGCFHCISRCIRRAFLCGDDAEHRRDWVRDAIRSAAGPFVVDVLAYAVMSNHLHLVVRTDPVRVADWSANIVARRWAAAHPPMATRSPGANPISRRMPTMSPGQQEHGSYGQEHGSYWELWTGHR